MLMPHQCETLNVKNVKKYSSEKFFNVLVKINFLPTFFDLNMVDFSIMSIAEKRVNPTTPESVASLSEKNC